MKYTAVIVDDFENTRFVIGLTLSMEGFNVLKAESGEEALKLFNGQPIDLLITDLNMPGMTGIELTSRIREKPEYRRLPILMLTTETDAAKKNEATIAGVTAIIKKPFERDDFIKKVKRAVGAI